MDDSGPSGTGNASAAARDLARLDAGTWCDGAPHPYPKDAAYLVAADADVRPLCSSCRGAAHAVAAEVAETPIHGADLAGARRRLAAQLGAAAQTQLPMTSHLASD